MEATLNIRLDASLKRRGNAVLEAAGLGPSDVVRSLWEELATTQKVPTFSTQRSKEDAEKAKKKAALAFLASFPKTPYSYMTDEELAEEYYSQFAE